MTAVPKTFARVDVSYLRKWLIIAVVIGIVAGAASVVFYLAIKWGRGDSNPHAFQHMILSHARLPVPTLPR